MRTGKKLLFRPSAVLDCFNQFLTIQAKELILKYSNLKAKRELGDDFKDVDMTELNAYIAMLYAGGITHQTNVKLDQLWSDSLFVPPIFSAVLPRARMREIKKHLRFDDKEQRDAKLESDKMAALRELYEVINGQFKSSYVPGTNLTVDERISPFRGRVSFKIYMPKKPHKYGIKLWVLCDSVTKYVVNFKVYCGKQNNKREVNQGENVVMDLTSHLAAGYNITTDNFFTSVPLAFKLLNRSRNPMTLLGTVRANRKYIPDFIKKHVGQEFDSCFAFSDDIMLVSYFPKEGKKAVVLLSSSAPTDKIMPPKVSKKDKREEKDKKKPEIIDSYNHTKCGVDVLDQMTGHMSVTRATRRWTVNLFCNMLEMIAINAYVSYTMSVDPKIERREFMILLVKDLCIPHVLRRDVFGSNLPQSVRMNIKKLIPQTQPQAVAVTAPQKKTEKNDRCDLCVGPKVKDKKFANRICIVCKRKICVDHLQPAKCNNCA